MVQAKSHSHNRLSQLKPKNGKYFVALLAGGPPDVAREIRGRLSDSRNILVKYHWDYQKSHDFQGVVSGDVDMVLLLKDMIGHANSDLAHKAAKEAGIPLIRTQRKWAIMGMTLMKYGFHKAELPLHLRSSAVLHEVKPSTEKEQSSIIDSPGELKGPQLPTDTKTYTVAVETATERPPVVGELPAPSQPGMSLRPETMALIAQLQNSLKQDHAVALISGDSISIEPFRK
jgi:hypothetical protein